MSNPKMQYVLDGFSQVREFRVFAFQCIAPDWTRSAYTVRTNLALAQRYGIPLQELPLLCKTVLERLDRVGDAVALTFTEEDMRVWAEAAAARKEAGKQRRPPRPPSNGKPGAAWRGAVPEMPRTVILTGK